MMGEVLCPDFSHNGTTGHGPRSPGRLLQVKASRACSCLSFRVLPRTDHPETSPMQSHLLHTVFAGLLHSCP
eukprot:1165302-Rhodomonas_salina.1